jgi:hypothetical protein
MVLRCIDTRIAHDADSRHTIKTTNITPGSNVGFYVQRPGLVAGIQAWVAEGYAGWFWGESAGDTRIVHDDNSRHTTKTIHGGFHIQGPAPGA